MIVTYRHTYRQTYRDTDIQTYTIQVFINRWWQSSWLTAPPYKSPLNRAGSLLVVTLIISSCSNRAGINRIGSQFINFSKLWKFLCSHWCLVYPSLKILLNSSKLTCWSPSISASWTISSSSSSEKFTPILHRNTLILTDLANISKMVPKSPKPHN